MSPKYSRIKKRFIHTYSAAAASIIDGKVTIEQIRNIEALYKARFIEWHKEYTSNTKQTKITDFMTEESDPALEGLSALFGE